MKVLIAFGAAVMDARDEAWLTAAVAALPIGTAVVAATDPIAVDWARKAPGVAVHSFHERYWRDRHEEMAAMCNAALIFRGGHHCEDLVYRVRARGIPVYRPHEAFPVRP